MATANLKSMTGVVVSAGNMMKTVKVRVVRQEWNRHLRKEFARPAHHLVNDPNDSLIEGDVITFLPERHSKHVLHTVSSVVAPFARPLSERPPLMSEAERNTHKDNKREAKLQRRAARGVPSALNELRQKAPAASRSTDSQLGESGAEMHESSNGPDTEHGRKVRSDGGHEFGKINDEAWAGKQRAMKRYQDAMKQESSP